MTRDVGATSEAAEVPAAAAVRTLGSRLRTVRRGVLVGVVVVHLLYPLAAVWALANGQQADGLTLIFLPVMFVVTTAVIGPLTWRAWQGYRVAPWALASFLALEVWLWRNGTRTESWKEPGSRERLATFQLVTHATALAMLVAATTALLGWTAWTRRQAATRLPRRQQRPLRSPKREAR